MRRSPTAAREEYPVYRFRRSDRIQNTIAVTTTAMITIVTRRLTSEKLVNMGAFRGQFAIWNEPLGVEKRASYCIVVQAAKAVYERPRENEFVLPFVVEHGSSANTTPTPPDPTRPYARTWAQARIFVTAPVPRAVYAMR
jgi:hypothetical protein